MRADGAPSRRSDASAIIAPAPAHTPSTAATIGCGQCRIAFTRSPVIRVNARSSGIVIRVSGPMISWTSPPEQKLPPAPRSTTALTSLAYASARKRSRNSAYRAGAVLPEAGHRVEPVLRRELVPWSAISATALNVLEDRLAHEVVEVDPHPAGLDALAAAGDLALELVGPLEVDAEQPVAVRAGAGAAAATLDAEQVVEDRHHEVVVQVAARRAPDHERHDRESLGVGVAEHLDGGMLAPGGHRATQEVLLVRADRRDADRVLEREDEPGADRLHDRGRAALLAVGGVEDVAVLLRVDVGDRAATDHVRHRVGEQPPADDEHPGRPGTADELVRRDEHRVLAGGRVAVVRVHLDVDVRRRGGDVPEGEGAVLVQEPGDPVGVGHDAGHVAGRAERPDLERRARRTAPARRRAGRRRCDRRRPRGWSPRRPIDSRQGSSLLWCS